jgi:hypothetical protein
VTLHRDHNADRTNRRSPIKDLSDKGYGMHRDKLGVRRACRGVRQNSPRPFTVAPKRVIQCSEAV